MTPPSLWVLRDPAGEIKGATGTLSARSALFDAAVVAEGARYALSRQCIDAPTATSYTHDGWALRLEPHPTPERGNG